VDHTGIVCHVAALGDTPRVLVWSKWGSLGEYQHEAHLTPYTDATIEYWRLEAPNER